MLSGGRFMLFHDVQNNAQNRSARFLKSLLTDLGWIESSNHTQDRCQYSLIGGKRWEGVSADP